MQGSIFDFDGLIADTELPAFLSWQEIDREFGLDLASDVEVRVYDSTADMRYFGIPARPAGAAGMSEEALASPITRDSMIGVAQVVAAHVQNLCKFLDSRRSLS